ncbi:shikimate dehydrogenase family protein [Qipengyuania spongiae]|uniref:Shikimate dehydrogenase (NADP(+)) n=1 Tax=Qipengyuania spongiae TaxID=2909673 RepID=A0ABY5T3S3_9SPHN|nr:shikimate dehydrogenase [Qipengyuania spongiae]UVI39991.1 shikimate dehydrogenase [Qipengyuania spongiae]
MSRPYAEVIGDPIAQSKSPAIHGFWLEKLGIAADYRATRVEANGLEAFFAAGRADPDWRGCNVTMPHKQGSMAFCDRLDERAGSVGAVNTIVSDGSDGLSGTNTDIAGFLEPLQAQLAERHYFRMARVLGTGGAARAIVSGLASHGFTLVLAGRDPDKARAILDELAPGGEHHAVDLAHFAGPTGFAFDDREGCLDLVVNASPLGMRGQPPLAFDWSHAPPGSIAYDIVTDPNETEFLRNARAAGFATVDGLSMLIGQAAAAFELFFGRPAPREHDAELRARLLK